MLWGFKNGETESIRLARQYAETNGMAGLSYIDAQPVSQPPGTLREKDIINWTVRSDGLPRGLYDDGPVILLVHLESGEVKQLGYAETA